MNSLLKRFGPSREAIWKQLCEQTGASFVEGGFWKGDKVQARHGEWTITLDTYTVNAGKVSLPFTRMRAPFVNPEQFRFTIYRKGLFSGIAKWFGMQDIEVGHPQFDDAFIIKGTHKDKLVALFADAQLRALISSQPDIHFSIADGEDGPTDELSFSVPGTINDTERLKLLFDLFSVTLDQLCHIGAAYENRP